ncbi:hypothetical protein [Hymenobacter negativus]|uniref:Lipoprotein n=1 Tax=Hymenobacter negativus TaxID=2795026 RepID=A0ABS3QGG4_9BACT|nr:hypothetical protein [Hymenobacter negativus]MBO2009805.1 hypothetical protein [Hymenobacter negativus]
MKVQLTIAAAALLLATGCEQAKQAKESYSAISKLSEAGKDMTANLEKAETDRAERVKRGDTLSLPYKELEQYLPTEVSGYTPGELKGQSQKMTGMAFSTAERTFTKSPDEEVEISLIDYNGSNALYQGAAAMMSLGIEQEDDDHIMGPTAVKADGVKGMDTFYKKDGRAEMTLAVGGRFLLTLKGTKQKDMALLKSIADDMDLEKLAKL